MNGPVFITSELREAHAYPAAVPASLKPSVRIFWLLQIEPNAENHWNLVQTFLPGFLNEDPCWGGGRQAGSVLQGVSARLRAGLRTSR